MEKDQIYAAARLLIEHCGCDGAERTAAENAEFLLARGDFRNAANWRSVYRAIRDVSKNEHFKRWDTRL